MVTAPGLALIESLRDLGNGLLTVVDFNKSLFAALVLFLTFFRLYVGV